MAPASTSPAAASSFALKAGGTGPKIVFAGVGKTDEEMRYGLDAGVLLFNVESEGELQALAEVAKGRGQIAQVALRVNPDLPPKTHVKTDTSVKGVKFGLDIDTVLEFARKMAGSDHVKIVGLHMHLGSPILSAQPYRQGIEKGVALIELLRKQGHPIKYMNMGGGFGIHYRKQEALPADAFAAVIVPAVQAAGMQADPGAGAVHRRQRGHPRQPGDLHQGFGRQALRHSGRRHERPDPADAVRLVSSHLAGCTAAGFPAPPEDYEGPIAGAIECDVVGPVCESGDFLAKDRALPPVQRGDLLATFSAGAYGMAMSSNYNGRPRAAEVLVDGDKSRLIRRRETLEDLIRPEIESDGDDRG